MTLDGEAQQLYPHSWRILSLRESATRWSPNSAGVVIDAICYAKLELERGIGGHLVAASAYYMKSPPKQMRDSVACELCDTFIQGKEDDEGASQAVAGE